MGLSQSSMNASYSGNVNGTLTNSSSCNNVLRSSGTYSCGIDPIVRTDFLHYTEASASAWDHNRWTNTSDCPNVDMAYINSVIRSQSLRTANGNYTSDEFQYIKKQQARMCIENVLSSCKQLRRDCLLNFTPDHHHRTEIPSTPRRPLRASVFGTVLDDSGEFCKQSKHVNVSVKVGSRSSKGNNSCDEDFYIQTQRMRIVTDNMLYNNTPLTRNGLFCNLEQGPIMYFEDVLSICSQKTTKDSFTICEPETTKDLSNSTDDKQHWAETPSKTIKLLEGISLSACGNYTSDEFQYIKKQQARMCIENVLSSCKQLRRDCLLNFTPDHHQRTEIPSTPRRPLRASVFGTVLDDSGKFRKQSKHGNASMKVGSRSSKDFIANIFQPGEQKTLDQFRRNVQRFAHMIQRRENLLLSYDHHLLVLETDNDAIYVTEYGLPVGFINIIDAALENSLGQIHYKRIIFNELFHPSASRVFLVYNKDHPNTTEQINALMVRLRYREGEKSYSFIYNNCEHYVNYLLTGNPISIQWRNASTASRLIGDALQKIPGVLITDGVKLVLQKCITKVQSKQVLVDSSLSEEEECERSTNDPAAQNTIGSKLRGVLKKRISSIHRRDLLFAMICALLKILIFCVHGGHSPERYIFEFIRIFGTETFLLLLRINRQLLEIVEKLLLWLQCVICTEDLLREIFKSGVVYLVCMSTVAVFFYGSDSTFCELFRRCFFIMSFSSFAGLLFDKGHYILNNIFRMLWIV